LSSGGPESKKNVLYIKEQVKHISTNYNKLVFGELSVDEFWKDLKSLLVTITTQKQYTDIVGKNASVELSRSSINLSKSMTDYRKSIDLGDDDRSESLEKNLIDDMRSVVERLDNLNLDEIKSSHNNSFSPPIITNSEITKPERLFTSKHFLMAAGVGGVAIIIAIFILYPRPEPIGFQPPIATTQTIHTMENKAVFIGLKAVDSNGPLSYYISSHPHNGTISSFNISTGMLIYTPALNYIGNDSFTFVAKNSNTNKSDSATVSIVIERSAQNKSEILNVIPSDIMPDSSNKKEVISLKYKSTLIPEQLRSPNLKSFTHGVTVEINATKPIMEKIANVTYFGKEGFTTLASNQEVSNSPTDNFRISFNALEGFPLYAKVYFKDNHVQNLTTNIVLK
jgi:Bacterial Ig domain